MATKQPPIITDEVIDELRRTGQPRARARKNFNAGRLTTRVVPQQGNPCLHKPNCWGPCFTYPDGTPLYCWDGQCTATEAQCGVWRY